MSGFPCLARTSSGSGLVRYSLGDRLVDRYLEFVAGRCRPNTLRAVAFDLKAFFAVVGKDPVTVTAADVFDFLADQRGDRTVIRLSDRESGLSVTGSGVAPHARSRRPPITRWSISVLLDHRLCSDQPFRRFPGVHVMLSILREPGGGAAGVWGDNLDGMTRPASLAGTCSCSGGQRRQALGARRQVPPRCLASSTAATAARAAAAGAIRMIFPPGMPPTITVWITTGAVSPVRPGSGGGRVAKAAGAAAPNARTAPASAVTKAAKRVMRRGDKCRSAGQWM